MGRDRRARPARTLGHRAAGRKVSTSSLPAMPHMSVRGGPHRRRPGRIFRVRFTGELGFEINVPADYGRAVWEAV